MVSLGPMVPCCMSRWLIFNVLLGANFSIVQSEPCCTMRAWAREMVASVSTMSFCGSRPMVVYALLIGKVIPACEPVSIVPEHVYGLVASFADVLELLQ